MYVPFSSYLSSFVSIDLQKSQDGYTLGWNLLIIIDHEELTNNKDL